MSLSHSLSHDVIIAGAGPVGLFLACELRLAACSVLVLEQAQDAYSPLKGLPFGLRGLSVATIESLDRRNLLDAIRAHAIGREAPAATHWLRQQRRPAGHFAGIQFFADRIDSAQWPWRLPGVAESLAVDMASIEAVLAERATALGAEIRHGCGVIAFEQSDAQVTVRTDTAAFRASWLIGCDGGRSMVRKRAGVDFAGTDPEFTGYSVEVTLADPAMLIPGRNHTAMGMYTFAPPGTIAMVDFDGGALHRTEPTREHVERVLRKVSGTEVRVAALALATTWTDRARQAGTYREGRVLLAGDAAHVHAPLGGQGLNLGLGDAMNLGWKLAAMIRGDAPPGLLDSYTMERHPVGAAVLDWSRAQVAVMRPDAGTRALRAILGDLVETRDGATWFAGRVLGTTLRYDLDEGHPLIGRSAPDFALVDGTRLNAYLRSGCGLLLDFAAQPSLRGLAEKYKERFAYLARDAEDRLGLRAILVRPDGVVAWAADAGDDDAGLAEAASRWFGTVRVP